MPRPGALTLLGYYDLATSLILFGLFGIVGDADFVIWLLAASGGHGLLLAWVYLTSGINPRWLHHVTLIDLSMVPLALGILWYLPPAWVVIGLTGTVMAHYVAYARVRMRVIVASVLAAYAQANRPNDPAARRRPRPTAPAPYQLDPVRPPVAVPSLDRRMPRQPER